MALHGSAANVMYLESFVESTGGLPTELQRILNTIKALDDKCTDLSAELAANVSALLAMPPAWQASSTAPGQGPGPSPEYDELCARVAGSQRLLVQWADEKVQLAQQAHDLLEVHALELERVTDDLDKELRRNNPDAGLTDYLNDFAIDAVAPATARGSVVKKKAASVANMQLATQPSSFDDYGGLEGGGMAGGGGGYDGDGAAPSEAPVPFMRPPPAGYKSSSSRPQAATGGLVRYLCDHDIKEDLVGRHAELFWPDDNLWYLIEIQEVSPATKEARVLYSTGDFETLNLEETARDMHMVLIPDQLY